MKYIFTAVYAYGETLKQTTDVSEKDPKRSRFYDVDQERLVRFILEGNAHTLAVDLRDGHFELDDFPFSLHGDDLQIDHYRLIYWRDVEVQSRVEVHIDEHGQPSPASTPKVEKQTTVFRVGWQGNDPTGKNHQRISNQAKRPSSATASRLKIARPT